MFIPFDIENGGNNCFLQLSSEYFILNSNITNGGGRRLESVFDPYVKSPESAIWSKYATDVHILQKLHPLIISEDSLKWFGIDSQFI